MNNQQKQQQQLEMYKAQQAQLQLEYNKKLENSTGIYCKNSECGSPYFDQVTILRKLSGSMDGSIQDEVVEIQTFICAICGEPIEELNPLSRLPK